MANICTIYDRAQMKVFYKRGPPVYRAGRPTELESGVEEKHFLSEVFVEVQLTHSSM